MADHTHGVQRSIKVRGKDLQGNVVILDKTHPTQLALFQTFLPEEDAEDKYSNTIELYDAIPKYFSNPKIMEAMRENGKYLQHLSASFGIAMSSTASTYAQHASKIALGNTKNIIRVAGKNSSKRPYGRSPVTK